MSFIDSDNPLGAEILKEAAEAYFAECKKMVASLDALRDFDRAAVSPATDSVPAARRSQLLDEAAERVHFVLIHRDAMKFAWSETFFEDYKVSAEVRARVGQRKRPV